MSADEHERARRIRRSAIILGLVALVVYLGFMILTASRGG